MNYLETVKNFIEHVVTEIRYFMIFPSCALDLKVNKLLKEICRSARGFSVQVIKRLSILLHKIILIFRIPVLFLLRLVASPAYEIRGFVYILLDLFNNRTEKEHKVKRIFNRAFNFTSDSISKISDKLVPVKESLIKLGLNVRRIIEKAFYPIKKFNLIVRYKVIGVRERLSILKLKINGIIECNRFYKEERRNYRREHRKHIFDVLGAAIKTREGQKIATSFVAMFFCVTLLVVGSTSFTWFAKVGLVNTKASGINMDKAYNYPTVSMFTYTDKTKGEGDTSLYEESVGSPLTTNSPIIVVDAAEKDVDGEFIQKSLHFGTIDNLVNIRKDNIVYLCFDVTPKKVGDGITINIKGAEKEVVDGNTVYPFTFYDQFDEEVEYTDPIYSKIDAIIGGSDAMPAFEFEYYVSSTKLTDPSTISDSDFREISTESHEIVYESVAEGNYYVYIKIIPNLTTFARMVANLTEYMPCVFLYDFDISYYINAN